MNKIEYSLDTRQLSSDIVQWFHDNKRDLPWRQSEDPYHIWISEVMLQQTQVDTVIPYYNTFVSRFPTLNDLAYADEETVLKTWEGLGYYSRARNLQKGVREVVETYGSKVPDNKKDILSIKGIGPYTAGAVLSIAYHQPEPAVDGNVMRVLSRVLLIDDDIAKARTRLLFENIIYDLIPETDPSGFNQGLMEIGALVCKPKQPKCDVCPIAAHCLANEEGAQLEYPVKKKKTPPKPLYFAVVVPQDQHQRVLIQKRPDKGLLANLWEFPMISVEPEQDNLDGIIECEMKNRYNIIVKPKDIETTVTHIFSHIKWHLNVYTADISTVGEDGETYRWVKEAALDSFPFPVSHQKVMKYIKAN
ncbi:A/G-specific DNA-adenine glycosylase [Scopulibacillus darangshiensis]|uniref:Adenine DNA glycosylase n=1 Tax=Scopulibacillus darangshiensis TaxID=442528 RepID=A0A4R2NS17_9BACL|nr:A/G-specific adenine glycosylase [Scopulibacillus darangshiensis]TCP24552.1 A/G-specific DNA-adenine glycosylase [Scopulibacillus darangshiensis]